MAMKGQPVFRKSVEELKELVRSTHLPFIIKGVTSEQDAAFEAALGFRPLAAERLEEIRACAARAIEGKGDCWWDPPRKK